jgi:hypothetical protein
MSNKNIDPFWFSDYSIIFDKNRLTEFFPASDMEYTEKLNSILRFSIYIAIVLFVYNRNINVIFIPIVTGLITLYLYRYFRDENTGKSLEELGNIEEKCIAPTKNNPFMNVLMSDYTEQPERPEACNIKKEEIKESAEENFNHNLYRDVSDVWNKTHSQRQFYTMPNTQIPNKQKEFAEWLYKTDKTCKEDPKQCIRFEDIRTNRPISIEEAKKQA